MYSSIAILSALYLAFSVCIRIAVVAINATSAGVLNKRILDYFILIRNFLVIFFLSLILLVTQLALTLI